SWARRWVYETVIAVLSACLIFLPDNFSNISPKSLTSHSELKDSSSLEVVGYTPDLIIDTFEVDSYTKGFMVYDKEADKYFSIYIPNEYAGEYEEELNKYLTSENYVPNIPEVYGTSSRTSLSETQKKFDNLVFNHLFNNALIEFANESQINLETASEKDLEALKKKVKEHLLTGAYWETKKDSTILRYKSYEDRMKEALLTPLSISIVALLLSIAIGAILPTNYCRFRKLKDKIQTDPNFTEFDVEQDFNNSTNIDKLWVGNKFIILLAFKNADIYLTENLASAFAFRMRVRRAPDLYYLFTMDFDGNKNVMRIPRSKIRLMLNLLETRCPNAYIGYSDELLDVALDSPNAIKRLNKGILDKSYVPTFTKLSHLLK
ncbi:MAG: hypothetical protein K2F59_01685, partial [Eubacteriales bacterium]|nr:hypothetical protein [Eubacteriales bacterium]